MCKSEDRNYPEKNNIPFKREDYVRQPNSVSRMEYKMDLIQLKAFACFLERLEPLVLQLISKHHENGVKDKRISIFDLPDAKPYINYDGKFEVEFPVKDLGVGWGYYARARSKILELGDIKIYYTTSNDKETRNTFDHPFTITEVIPKGQKKVKSMSIAVPRSVLDQMVDVTLGYKDLLKRIVFLVSNIYTARLYVFAASHLMNYNSSSFEVDIKELRNFLDLYTEKDGVLKVKYARYCDLKRKVLTPAIEELKQLAENGNSDFWIDITGIGKGEEGNPLKFKFDVFYSDMSSHFSQSKEQNKEWMELTDKMSAHLKQTPSNIKKMQQLIIPGMYKEFAEEINRLISLIEKRKDIENVRAFAWTALYSWLQDRLPKAEEVVEKEQTHEKSVKDSPVQTQLSFTEDIDPRWNTLLDNLKTIMTEKDFNTWINPVNFISFIDGALTIGIPNKIFFDILKERFVVQIQEAAKKAFAEFKELQCRIQN